MRGVLGMALAGVFGLGVVSVAGGQELVNLPRGGFAALEGGWDTRFPPGVVPAPADAPPVDSSGHVVYFPPSLNPSGFYGYRTGSAMNAGYAGFASAALYSYGGYYGAPSSWYGPYDYGYAPDYGYFPRACDHCLGRP